MKGSQERSMLSWANKSEIHSRDNEKWASTSMNKEPKLGVSRGGKRTLEEIQGTESNREEHNSKFVKQYSLKW